MRGRKWRFCSSVPKAIRVGPIMFMLNEIGSGAGANASSSLKMYCCTALQPVPPHSAAHDGVAQPCSCRMRTQRSISGFEMRWPSSHLRRMSGGRACAKKARTSSRNAISSSV